MRNSEFLLRIIQSDPFSQIRTIQNLTFERGAERHEDLENPEPVSRQA